MRLLGYALALLVYAAALAALGNPWAGVAAATLSLAATIAFECIQASQRATAAEDAEDGNERLAMLEKNVREGYALTNARIDEKIERIAALEAQVAATRDADLEKKIVVLELQVAALKRNAALNQVG